MASAKQRKATFISNKLKLLKDQGDDLTSAVGQYVNRITAAGDAWTQGGRGEDNVECQELCHMIDAAVLFLCEKCEELADLTSQSITAAASTPPTSYRQATESAQPADEDQLKSALVKIAVIEEALYSFRSRTDTVAEQQSGIDQQLKELLSKLSESDKKYSSRFKQVKQQISDINDAQDAIEQGQKTRLQSLEKQLQKISTTQDRLKAEIEKLVHVPNLLESMKENVDALDDRIDKIIDDSSIKYKDLETEMRDLADKVMANTQSDQLISEGQALKMTLLRELETRLQTLEADGGRNVKYVLKQAESGAANFRILCQMLNDRLRPLEQLRTCLNERASKRDDNVAKLTQLIQEVAVMSPRLQQLEVKSPGTRCGFSAWASFTGEVVGNTIIRQYETTDCNVGKNFNADSGIFTAPVDGLYVPAISVRLWENEHLNVSVDIQQSMDQESGTHVCWSTAATKDTNACDVGVVGMKAGDVLFSRVYVYDMKKKNYDIEISFSCFLLG